MACTNLSARQVRAEGCGSIYCNRDRDFDRDTNVMWQELAQALGLMLVIEGILPFLYPGRWRRLVASLAAITNRQLRLMGLVSMLVGLGVLFLIR